MRTWIAIYMLAPLFHVFKSHHNIPMSEAFLKVFQLSSEKDTL